MRKQILVLLAGAMLMMATSAMAIPITVGFHNITNNTTDIASQLQLKIYDATDAHSEYSSLNLTSTEFLFAFTNTAVIASNIMDIYIDNGPLSSLVSVKNNLSGITNFTGGTVTPGNLPGGNSVSPVFVADAILSADAQNGAGGKWGINSSLDTLGIVYTMTNSLGLSAISNALDNGELRIGLHVQSIGTNEGSDSYVNNGSAPVPEPGTMMLLGVGMFGLAAYGKRRMNKEA